MKNFKECKSVFEDYSKGLISQRDFDEWSKRNCDKCFFFIGKHCIFGKKK